MSVEETVLRWYAVRCFIASREPGRTYEERITIWRTSGEEEAFLAAEREAREYVEIVPEGRYLEYQQLYFIGDEAELPQGTEVFSLIRSSELKPKRYLRKFFETGQEYQRH